jgi:hypothetical protein
MSNRVNLPAVLTNPSQPKEGNSLELVMTHQCTVTYMLSLNPRLQSGNNKVTEFATVLQATTKLQNLQLYFKRRSAFTCPMSLKITV